MRIWHPIPPFCLDDKRLLGEHRELHAIWSVLTNPEKKGYRNHPETKRWVGHLLELSFRHDELVKEMRRRGWNHKSPILTPPSSFFPLQDFIFWPDTWEPVETMRQKLADKIASSL